MLRKIFPLIIICCFLAFLSVKVFAQKYNFRNYTTQDGLANNLVIDLLQDKSGRIWISTGDGISCYDGIKFQNYTTDDGLNNNRVYTIYQQFDNLFWIGTETGLTKLEFKNGKEIFTTINEKEISSIGAVTSILEKDGKVLFIGKTGIVKLDKNTFSLIPNLPTTNQMRFRCGYKDLEENLWVGSSQGLIKLDLTSGQHRVYNDKDGIFSTDLIRGIYQDNAKDFWICFQESGILQVRFQNQNITKTQHFTEKDGLPSNLCFKLLQDFAGNYWVTTYNGIAKFKLEKDIDSSSPDQLGSLHNLQIYQEQNGLIHNNMNPVLMDREQNLWFGTHHGLSKLASERFANYDVSTGLLSNTVYKTIQDSEGDIWVATHKGVNLLSGNKALNLSEINPILGNDTASLFLGSEEKIWVIQEQNGVFAFKKKRKGEKIFLERVASLGIKEGVNRPISLVEDKLGQIWIANYSNELICYDGENTKIYSSSKTKDFPETRFLSINIDVKGNVWVGGYEGAIKVSIEKDTEPKFKYYFSREGLSAKRVSHIYEDSRENIWFSSDNSGLFKWDGEKFTRYTTADGLSSNTTYAVLESPKDTLWIATSKGVDKFIKREFKNYNYNDATNLKSSDVKWIMADKDKSLWFATSFGLKKYIPSLDYQVKTPPKIEIQTIKLNQKPLGYSKYTDLLENKFVLFQYFENNFEFEFLGISFINEDLIFYKHILEGYDKDWLTAKDRVAKYPYLVPGKYLLKVKALNKYGLESEVKILEFEVEKPFWLKPWFLILSSIGFMMMIYGGYSYQIRKIEKQKLLLEVLVKERTNEVISQKNELESKNLELNEKNEELNKKNEELIKSKEELIQSNQKVEAIFSALSDLLPGTVLDNKYRLEDKIGSGGFGIVFRATHLNLNRDVAIKVFRPIDNNVTLEALERFQMEGASACRVNHPNAISILDSGITSTGIPYLVMELLKGYTLSAELRRKRYLSTTRCAEILLPVCNALSKAHAAGIIHRDIKPDNIFLHKDASGEVVKVLDFGIAKLLGDAASTKNRTLTEAGSIVGTPNYMAPERLSHKPYDGKADVYSVGIMLYEMLLGYTPFQASKEDFWSIISSHLAEAPPSIVETNPDISKEIEDIVFQALSKDPKDRPTAKELGDKLSIIVGFNKQANTSGALSLEAITTLNTEDIDITTQILTNNTPQTTPFTNSPQTNSFEKTISKAKIDSFEKTTDEKSASEKNPPQSRTDSFEQNITLQLPKD
ncbi:MAG: protein kinase [Acidobacteria bacterium]|nr:protein kinase [Acidobacteriota bacterium]